ncbi:MAG: M1 family metallopeptidase [Myxococcales bacterium]|nr:M1 family metallopeptidase [Myxococcales bacterium]
MPPSPALRSPSAAGLLALLLSACPQPPGASSPRPSAPAPSADKAAEAATPTETIDLEASARDPLSYARADEVVVRELDLDLEVLFERREIVGRATYLIERHDPAAPLRLDTRDLTVESVSIGTPRGERAPRWASAGYRLGAAHPELGAPLIVDLPEGVDRVEIRWRTSPDASGLHWLSPAQTRGDAPFLYSQSQAIHARSWIPCQDSPAIRATVRATVTVDRPLRPVMAAVDRGLDPTSETPRYRFALDQAIPAYLLAIAVGDLERRELGPRTAVWAEPATLPAAADELAELEAMLAAIEATFGPYRWGRYEVLILPPSFPFGGMENPVVTFATPTILAGDRSLVALIAHELAHSWSGNLVTNASWDDLWLNEGPTTYLERRIIEALYGRERAAMEWTLGAQLLRAELEHMPASEQALRPARRGRDPEAVFSDVAYEKGALLLRTLEGAYGRETFDPVLRAWFDEHAFTGQTTAAFVDFVGARLDAATPLPGRERPSLDAWIYGPGLPNDAALPTAGGFATVEAATAAWLAGERDTAALGEGWGPLHWLHFLGRLPEDIPAERLAELDSQHRLTATTNLEVLAAWLEVAARRGYAGVDARLRVFLTTFGRLKYLAPIYRALLSAENDGRARALYNEARPTYHPIARAALDSLVGFDPAAAQPASPPG